MSYVRRDRRNKIATLQADLYIANQRLADLGVVNERLRIERDEAVATKAYTERLLKDANDALRVQTDLVASLKAKIKHGANAIAFLNREVTFYRDVVKESERLFSLATPSGVQAILPQAGELHDKGGALIEPRKEYCWDTETN